MRLRKHTSFLFFSVAGILAMSWVVIGLQNRRIDENALKNAGKTGEEWLTYGLNFQETRYSPLKQIDATNVGRLGLAWTYEIGPGGGNQEGTLLMANGVVYGITNWSITYAVDARTGKELWRYDPKVDQPTTHENLLWRREVAVSPSTTARSLCLSLTEDSSRWTLRKEQRSGVCRQRPWITVYDDQRLRASRKQSHRGNAGAEKPVRGFFSAYNTNTGKLEWRFYTVPVTRQRIREQGNGNGCKDMGRRMVEDGRWCDRLGFHHLRPRHQPGYGWNGQRRSMARRITPVEGARTNLFIASAVAVDADNGEYKWHYQFVPGDSWDFDSVQH
jgi:quinohemoprotein ethanol dehydrogenase